MAASIMGLGTVGNGGWGLAVADGVGVGVGVFGRRLLEGLGWYCFVIPLIGIFDFFLGGGLAWLPAFPASGATCMLVKTRFFVILSKNVKIQSREERWF